MMALLMASQPRSPGMAVRTPVELIEDLLFLAGLESRAVIGDRDHHALILQNGRDLDRFRLRAVFIGVFDGVDQNQLDQQSIHPHQGQIGIHLDPHEPGLQSPGQLPQGRSDDLFRQM